MSPRPLEPSDAEMRALVARAMDFIAPHVASLAEQPASDVEGGLSAARAMIEPMPEHGASAEVVLARLFRDVIPKSFNAAGPGYLAYIPGGGVFASAVADLVGDAVNRYIGVWAAAPALAQLEATTARWLCDLAGYPPSSKGLLTTGGSLANLTAVITARVDRLPEDFLGGTIFVSDQAHHSVQKAARLAGFPARAVRSIPTDERYRVRVDAMAAAISAERATGRSPFLIVASAGTTNTGAIDDLVGLADLAARERMWLHVDAAYGGFFLLTERGRAAMRGIERADSITLDPHKALFLPYGNGALLVRDGDALRRAHEVSAEYMPEMQAEPEHVDFCAVSPELSRDPRGLRLWLPLMLHGAAAFRDCLDEKLDLIVLATALIRAIPHVRIVAEAQLTAIAFRLEPPGLSPAQHDELNTRWLDEVVARKRVFVRATVLGGRVTPRLCILSFRTHEDRVRAACEDLADVARALVGAAGLARADDLGRRSPRADCAAAPFPRRCSCRKLRATMKTLAFALPIALLLAAPSVARADDSAISLFKFGVGPMAAVGGNFLGKPGDKTYPGGTVDVYPGFSGTEFGYGAYLEGRILGLVGIEIDVLRYSGKASGDITINNVAGTLEITQTATHIPVLAKGVLPLPVVAPFIFVGPEFVFVSDNGASVSGELGKSVSANGAHSDNYKYWTFGFGLEIKLPIPDLDIRIPISIRGSYNPSVSDHVVDRWTISNNNFATNNQFQYMAQGAVGVGIYF